MGQCDTVGPADNSSMTSMDSDRLKYPPEDFPDMSDKPISFVSAACPFCKKGVLLPVLMNNQAQGGMGSQTQIIYKCTECEEIFKY